MRIKTRLLRRKVPRNRPVAATAFAHGRASVAFMRRLATAALARRNRASAAPVATRATATGTVASLDFHVIGWGG